MTDCLYGRCRITYRMYKKIFIVLPAAVYMKYKFFGISKALIFSIYGFPFWPSRPFSILTAKLKPDVRPEKYRKSVHLMVFLNRSFRRSKRFNKVIEPPTFAGGYKKIFHIIVKCNILSYSPYSFRQLSLTTLFDKSAVSLLFRQLVTSVQ